MAMLLDRRYNPFNELENWNRAFFGDTSLAEFKTDIRDLGDSFLLEADLPGFRKEEINLSLNGDVLTIKAVRHSGMRRKPSARATCGVSGATAPTPAALM